MTMQYNNQLLNRSNKNVNINMKINDQQLYKTTTSWRCSMVQQE